MQRERDQVPEAQSAPRAASAGLTPDEPYRPDFAAAADEAEVSRSVRSGSRRPSQAPRASMWEPPQGRKGSSLLPDLDPTMRARLTDAEAKVDRGELLDADELRYLAYRGTLRLLASRRPGTVAIAVQVLERLSRAANAERESVQAFGLLNVP